MKNNIIKILFYFLLSTIITWWFIQRGKTLYFSFNKMLLSCSIAGAKWSMQVIAAYFFLHKKKWIFIKRIAFVCFIGSCILLPYCFFNSVRLLQNSFLLSLLVAIVGMIILYYKAVIKTAISLKWFWGWMFCLAIAISLQLFVVFKIL